ncbi:MAG: carbon-nitrogen hydrolase family protein [Crenarchaeota archaeon]|nr:carbon-nitrogen hydrolase family protein [Thermoproteota archaeon]
MAKHIRITTVTFRGIKGETVNETIENNIREILRLLNIAIFDKPDLICLPECSPFLGLSMEEMVKNAEEIPEALFTRVSSFARQNRVYVIFPMMRREDSKVYNSAVLIGRDGEYVGSYDKVHPTIWEIEAGVTPGVEARTFKLEFGKIGVAICFDLNFEDVIKSLAGNRVKIVFFPSMYPGGLQLKFWAFNHGVYVASSVADDRGSMIINPLGRVLAVSSSYQPVICCDINLDYEVLHLDYNWEKMNQVKEKYGPKISFEVSRPEAVFLMSCEAEETVVENIIKEFNLETREEYFKRASDARDAALKKQCSHSAKG